jgi:hypothetical protein
VVQHAKVARIGNDSASHRQSSGLLQEGKAGRSSAVLEQRRSLVRKLVVAGMLAAFAAAVALAPVAVPGSAVAAEKKKEIKAKTKVEKKKKPTSKM